MNHPNPKVMGLPLSLRQRAWDALVQELGVADAVRFIMAIEPGKGDSVEQYRTMWEGKTLEEIYEAVMEFQRYSSEYPK